MFTQELFELALNIQDPWYIKDIQFKAEQKRLDIHIDFRKGSIFHYESAQENIKGDFKVYDTVEKQWRHLNFFQHECYLHARVPRLDVTDTVKRLINVPWAGLGNGFTLLFEALVLQLASHMPVHTVSQIINESDYKIWAMLERYVNKSLANNDYSDLKVIGMDETAKSRGHDYITLFVDLIKKRTVFIAEGKGQQTVESFVNDLKAHNGTAEAIMDVSCDMSPAFIKGIKDNLPNAKMTFDRFHIMKVMGTAVDTVRKQEAITRYAVLKGTKYIFLKNEKNLTDAQRQQRLELSMPHMNLKSIKSLHIRENFQEIYKASTPDLFESMLKKWYFWATHCRIQPMIEAARTIKEHWEGIVQWKKSNIDNGLLEGLNSLIQAAKAKARGFSTFRYFRIVVFLITGRLNFAQFNKHYLPI
jgi:transposase